MKQIDPLSRRRFTAHAATLGAGSTLAGVALPRVHAAEDNTIRLALIGCGGRGCGAVADAMASAHGPVKLVAMADIFENRLANAHGVLSKQFADRLEVPADRRFVGFDSYRKAIDCLRPGGDVAMLTGYAAWRALQLEYAVSRGVNVFMEKSFACDPPGVRRILAAAEAAGKRGVKIAAGLMARHSKNRQELIRRIRDGVLGEIRSVRAYRMHGCGTLKPRAPEERELDWQIRHFTHFLWVSGGLYAEMNIHQVDEICWIMDAWPIAAHGVGGRIAGSTDCGQNLDSLSIEWTFPDGAKGYHTTRWLPGCHNDFGTYIHGTQRAALFPWLAGRRSRVAIYKDQRVAPDNVQWTTEEEGSCTDWQAEWNAFLDSIRNDRPHNEARYAALSNLADIMGRAAVHSGRQIAWDQAMTSEFRFCPDADTLTPDSPPPVRADAQGRYPVPVPGRWSEI